MGINIVGNVNGSYHAPAINLFDLANKQDQKQPTSKRNAKDMEDVPNVTMQISEEGLRALHGSELSGSVDLQKQVEELKYISEHQPVESFRNRLQMILPNSYLENKTSTEQKGDTLLKGFQKIADEIVSGYNSGDRVRFVEDDDSEDGYRRLNKTDELSFLQDDFEEYVEKRFGETHQKESGIIANQMSTLQDVKMKYGLDDEKEYEPEKVPKDFVENLKKSGRTYIANLLKN